MANLADFEGKAVRQVGIEMPGAAGGLRDAMKVAPEQFLQGEEVWIAIKARVAKVRHEPIDKNELDGDQRRVHVLDVEAATFVDAEIVGKQIAEMQERIVRQREREQGVSRLPTDEELAQLKAEHDAGEHTMVVPGCGDCAVEENRREMEANEPTSIAGRKKKGAK